MKRLVVAGIFGGLMALAVVLPVFACEAVERGVSQIGSARGYAFVGLVTDVTAVVDPVFGGDLHNRTTFKLEHVYAGDFGDIQSGPDEWTIWTDKCDEPGDFEAGARYFVSTADLEKPNLEDTLAWRIDGEEATLVSFVAFDGTPNAILLVSSLNEAVRLMTRGLPDTSTELEAVPMEDARLYLFALIAAASSAVATFGLIRRRRLVSSL